MSIRMETKRTKFYAELPEDKREKYFYIKREKYLPTIDNLYYGVYIEDDKRDDMRLENWFDMLEDLKDKAIISRQPVEYGSELMLVLGGCYSCYRFCLSNPDLYDIYICSTLPNDNTPRVIVQMRAIGLWTRGVEQMLTESYNKISDILGNYGCTIQKCRENRIDYCYHTNAVSSPDKIFREVAGRVKYVYSNLKQAVTYSDLERVGDGTIFHKDYVLFGRQKSNNVLARVYNKGKEVIENGYKNFFFQLWYDNQLISYYDKWCLEYTMPYKNMDYLDKARLAFYVEYGTDEKKRKEFIDALASEKTTMQYIRQLANDYMPKITVVINIEYQTMRKFYKHSDDFIDGFKTVKHDVPKPLERLYKILDNKSIFLDYLTEHTLCFRKKEDEYVAWWQRLRDTKLGGIKSDEKMLREYNHMMDRRCVLKRTVNDIASVSVYDDKVESGFVADLSDMLAYISDNQAHKNGMMLVTADGEVVDDVYGGLVKEYLTIKRKKERLMRNRKKTGYPKKPLTDEVKQNIYDLHDKKYTLRYIAEDVGLTIGEAKRVIDDYKRKL